MDEDDLPPQPREREGSSFGGAIGTTIGRLLWIFLPMAVVLNGLVACGHGAKLVQLSDMTPFELTDLKDRPLRVGLIVPSSNTVMEPDFHQQIGRTAIVSTTRIFLEEVTREEELRMLDNDLPKAAELIRTTAPDLVIFGCTSAGALGTLAHDREIGDRCTHHRGRIEIRPQDHRAGCEGPAVGVSEDAEMLLIREA